MPNILFLEGDGHSISNLGNFRIVPYLGTHTARILKEFGVSADIRLGHTYEIANLYSNYLHTAMVAMGYSDSVYLSDIMNSPPGGVIFSQNCLFASPSSQPLEEVLSDFRPDVVISADFASFKTAYHYAANNFTHSYKIFSLYYLTKEDIHSPTELLSPVKHYNAFKHLCLKQRMRFSKYIDPRDYEAIETVIFKPVAKSLYIQAARTIKALSSRNIIELRLADRRRLEYLSGHSQALS
jgi:hypothetical protein